MQPREFEAALNDLEKRLDRLRALYEQFFRGYETVEPLIPRKDFERRLYRMRKQKPRNTAMRFRFQQLMQRYTMFTSRWGRLTRQIEEGTHPMVLERLRRRRRREEPPPPREEPADRAQEEADPQSYELDLSQELDVEELLTEAEMSEVTEAIDRPGAHRATQPPRAMHGFQRNAPPVEPVSAESAGGAQDEDNQDQATGRHRPVSAQPPPARAVPPPVPGGPQRSFGRPAGKVAPAASGPRPAPRAPGPQPSPGAREPGLGETRVRAIYDEFLRARRANNESDNVRYEAVANRIERMLPRLRKKHGGRDIDFEVVVRNGRVGLRPRAR